MSQFKVYKPGLFSLYIMSDIDECLLGPDLCENGQCINFNGGYMCECDMGFAPSEDERICVGKIVASFKAVR